MHYDYTVLPRLMKSRGIGVNELRDTLLIQKLQYACTRTIMNHIENLYAPSATMLAAYATILDVPVSTFFKAEGRYIPPLSCDRRLPLAIRKVKKKKGGNG